MLNAIKRLYTEKILSLKDNKVMLTHCKGTGEDQINCSDRKTCGHKLKVPGNLHGDKYLGVICQILTNHKSHALLSPHVFSLGLLPPAWHSEELSFLSLGKHHQPDTARDAIWDSLRPLFCCCFSFLFAQLTKKKRQNYTGKLCFPPLRFTVLEHSQSERRQLTVSL